MADCVFSSAEEFAASLTPVLKKLGYRKRCLTWYKENEDATIIFHIQKSQFGRDVWYYCFGVDIFQLSGTHARSMDGCQVRDRYNQREGSVYLSPEKLVEMITIWEQNYGIVSALVQRLQEHKLPFMTFGSAIRFLVIYSGMPETEFDKQTPQIYERYYGQIDLWKLSESFD